MSPSQIAPLSIHSPLAQVASYEAHASGGLAVGIIPKQLLWNQPSDHLSSDHSPHSPKTEPAPTQIML